jgi:ribosomal protein L5
LGILSDEDAQCFRIRSGLNIGVYVLAVGAVLLAFLKAFVKTAADQYLRDKKKKKSTMINDVHAVEVEREDSMDMTP